jgi:uncharacterized protein YndB with AHSA1/START domain
MTTTTTEGTLITVDGKPALRFVRRYRHPIERVWRAVSDPGEMAQWFPSNVEGDRAVGAELIFDDDAQRAAAQEAGEPTRADGPRFRGTVVAYDPPQVFSFTWGGELIRLELAPDGDGTTLVFTQILSHPSVAARNGAGWHTCLGELDRLLGAPAPQADEDGLAVYDDYLDRMGPPLGTPTGDGGVTWERSTHVTPEQVREATSSPAALEAWGATGRAADPQRWEVAATDHGSVFRLTVGGIGQDAERAATWHALLVQLDMYLAAGQLIPAEPARWIPAYRSVL